MSNKDLNHPPEQANQTEQANQNASHEADRRPIDPSQIVDVTELVYKGGYDRDPQEILGNPAVAPPMLSEGRDLRVDIFHEAEETIPKETEETSDNQGSAAD